MNTLEQLISDISEDCYRAGWLIGCEFAVWALVVGDDPGPMWFADAAQLAALRAEADRVGGWATWDDYRQSGPHFVPMADWLELYRQYS